MLSQLLRLPVMMWLYGVDSAQRVMRNLPAGLPEPAAPPALPPARLVTRNRDAAESNPVPESDLAAVSDFTILSAELLTRSEDARTQPPTENDMDDMNLSDDMVKLVSYDIVSIARGAERIIHSDSTIVTDNTSSEAFSSWMIARFLQRGDAAQIAESERQYLRVSYRVKDRWPKQSLYYEERQLATLKGIEKALLEANQPKLADGPETPRITDGSSDS